MDLDDDAKYAALAARDPRFDGVFFVAVSTTGIYCRPICPAKTPGRARVTFYASAALAEKAGYRACFRCRPELAPGHADVDAVDQLVQAAARRIAEGALNAGSVDDLAAELGVSARHLRRATELRLGVSPVELAQTRRLALAKQLLQDTQLPIAQIAFAAGFGSVRRFNALFAATMGRSPTRVRRGGRQVAGPAGAGVVLRLDYRPPYAWRELVAFLRARAIPGVEEIVGDTYRRVVRVGRVGRAGGVGDRAGVITVRQAPGRHALELAVASELVGELMPLVARVRRMFDLDARPHAIADVLAGCPVVGPRVAARPGLRVPGAVDPFEAAMRALLGQQITVAAATTLAGRLVARFGTPLPAPDGALTHAFPLPRTIARAPVAALAALGLPGKRAAALAAIAQAIDTRALDLDARELAAFVASAVALPGIGPWTAHYLAMRANHLPDAFPAGDLGVKKALARSERECETYAARWRPFRAYAVLHLWTGGLDDRADLATVSVADRAPAPRRTRRRDRRADAAEPAAAARDRRAGDRARARARRAPADRVLRR